jgi:hypothetical protein
MAAGPARERGVSDEDPDAPELSRLDPDAVAPPPSPDARAPDGPPRAPRPPVVDTRRYRWAIGGIGLALIAAISIYQFASHGAGGGPGVPVGQRLRWFSAPIAASALRGDPNLHPPCTAAAHESGALNLCLDAHTAPVVVSFFVPASSSCVRQVDALQALAPRYPSVRFLAVAVDTSAAKALALVRAHHWSIPVAYDEDGSVGGLYSVAVCPMAELAARGGIVRDRLIGDRWQTAAQLAPRVRALAAGR